MRTVTHTISIPYDLFDEDLESYKEDMLNYAIQYCRDAEDSPFTDWCVPAEWSAEFANDSEQSAEVEIIVTRVSNLIKETT